MPICYGIEVFYFLNGENFIDLNLYSLTSIGLNQLLRLNASVSKNHSFVNSVRIKKMSGFLKTNN